MKSIAKISEQQTYFKLITQLFKLFRSRFSFHNKNQQGVKQQSSLKLSKKKLCQLLSTVKPYSNQDYLGKVIKNKNKLKIEMSHSLETSNLNETSIDVFRKILVKISSTHIGFLFPSAGERMLQGRLTGYLTLCGLRREPRILRASELCLHTASTFCQPQKGLMGNHKALHSGRRCPQGWPGSSPACTGNPREGQRETGACLSSLKINQIFNDNKFIFGIINCVI